MSKKIISILSGLGLVISFYLLCIHYTDINEVAICRNEFTGNLWLDDKAGISITSPWTRAVIIDTRPIRVCVSSSSRSFNCRLVEFDKTGWRELIELEGFRYFWLDNRLSYNSGYDDEYRGMKDLLRGYSFDANKRTFIKVSNIIE